MRHTPIRFWQSHSHPDVKMVEQTPPCLSIAVQIGRFIGIAMLLWFTGFSNAKAVEYVYNEIDRLVETVDNAGNSSLYRYDSVGNLLSIRRFDSSGLAIAEFNPDRGPVNTLVTIYGVGFSATLTNNIVKFNGVTATVVSATSTKLTARVPIGATTGPINIIVGTATATSDDTFTVGKSLNLPPVITSFTPSSGEAGSTLLIIINGNNFDPIPTGNVVKFNNTVATVSNSLTTQISTSVPPNATSGRISIRTSSGEAVSENDFIVNPLGTGSSIGRTARIAVNGEPLAINNSGSNPAMMVLFDGVQGENLSIGFNASMIFSLGVTSGSVNFKVFSPKGESLGTPLTVSGSLTSSSFTKSLDLPVLPETETYTLLVDPNIDLYLSDLSVTRDITGELIANGPTNNFAATKIGQNAHYSFYGTVGQDLSLMLDNNALPGTTNINILRPDGSLFLQNNISSVNEKVIDFPDSPPSTGVYKVVVAPAELAVGSLSVALRADDIKTVPVNGVTTPVSLLPGQMGQYRFNGVAGQNYGVGVPSINNGGFPVAFSILRPNDLASLSCGNFVGALGGGCDFLPSGVWLSDSEAGTHTVFVNPGVAGAAFDLYVSSDIAGSLEVNGAAKVFTTPRPGRNARYSFAGTYGQNLKLSLTQNSFPGTTSIKILKPDGTALINAAISTATYSFNLPTLPYTESFTIWVSPSGNATGAMTLQLQQQ